MGLSNWAILGTLLGDRVQRGRAAKKARTEPLVIEADSLAHDEMHWYGVWSEEDRLTYAAEFTIHGPPVGLELYSAVDFERRQRGEEADPIVSKHGVKGDVELTESVPEGQYVVVIYREDAPISRHDPGTKDGVTDYEIKIRFR